MAQNKLDRRTRVSVDAEAPWYDVKDVCQRFGVTYPTAKNQIQANEFPVPTYKLGKKIVVDKAVYDAYFAKMRDAGLRQLHKSTRS